MILKIKKGRHRSWSLRPILKFGRFIMTVRLHKSMWYPGGGTGWNKLPGVSGILIHRNSFRIAWRPAEEEGMFRLATYEYIDGKRIINELDKLYSAGDGDSFIIDKPMVYFVGFYFGGQDKAPHNMQCEINLKKL
jgi:hypothetical protein